MYLANVFLSQSGLTQAVRDSKITLEQAEYEFLSFIRQHTPPGQCPLAGELIFGTSSTVIQLPNSCAFIPLSTGNSVHADKRFLDKFMPQFMYHLHYRIIDVSTIKELCRLVFVWLWSVWDYVRLHKVVETFSALTFCVMRPFFYEGCVLFQWSVSENVLNFHISCISSVHWR